ncbi:hypothetical protein GIB67_022613 [Kingdonia uniflora]|uniref:valine--tRNA ligase n=1 Tax=Kingdonia uniflora TaxID=39325 RepID=A0A7J7P822_9MAGN|nr:hypothetical protein GIB67_022613 [Kingdonia uniflora]
MIRHDKNKFLMILRRLSHSPSNFTIRRQQNLPSTYFALLSSSNRPFIMEAQPESNEEIDERKKKKEEKAKEKEAKRLKAQKKAEEAAKAQAQKVSGVPKKEKPGKKSWKPDAEEVNPDDFIDPVTPHGEKKQLSRKMAEQYNPNAVEKSWYSWWEKSGFFVADANSSKPSFTIVLPPPNVTGALHIGHGLTAAIQLTLILSLHGPHIIQDTIIRWRRMSGYNTLWVPGMDHAGIATQVVVEKKIMRESKLTRHELGREKFVSEVWKWKNEYGGTILNQERRLATSLDWSRECFTMDEQRSKAVTEAFVQLYRENLIYSMIYET